MIPRLDAHISLLGYALVLSPWGLLTHDWIHNHKHCIVEIGSQIDWISKESYNAAKYDESLLQVEGDGVWRRWWWRWWWWQHFVVDEIWLWCGLRVSWFLLSSSSQKVGVPSQYILGLTSRTQRQVVRPVGTAGRYGRPVVPLSLSFPRLDFQIVLPWWWLQLDIFP